MKVVLIKDVPKVGRKYDIKDVADGFARNYIIKNKLGEMATPKNIQWAENERSRFGAEKKLRDELLAKNFESLAGATINLTEKANEQGHLFAGVHKPEIIAEVLKETRLQIDAEHLDMDKPIKTAGEHEVKFQVGDKKGTFKVVIEAIT